MNKTRFGDGYVAHTFDRLLLKVLLRYGIRVPLPERNPFQLVVLIFICITSFALLAHTKITGPQSLDVLGVSGVIITWVIAVGASSGICGLLLKDREIGLAIEQYAHAILCFGSWGYVIAVVSYSGISQGIIVVGYTAGVAVGAWTRAMHILIFNRQIAALTRGIE